ncbi:MAG: hypothetical protein H7255_17915 [Ramlibacter sp.]|nr:hypothetical protein [Ramlibacter sp.]
MALIDGQKPATLAQAPAPAAPQAANKIDKRNVQIKPSADRLERPFQELAGVTRGHLAGRVIATTPGGARAVRAHIQEAPAVDARVRFMASCRTAMLFAGGGLVTHQDELAVAVIDAAFHFNTLRDSGGLEGEYGTLVKAYQTHLDGLIDAVAPLRNVQLAAAMTTLGIKVRQQDTNG